MNLDEWVEEARERLAPWAVPDGVTLAGWWARVALSAIFAWWGWRLLRLSVPEGEMMTSFIHGPLLVFHEAGHVLFGLFGRWLMVAGGSLMQLIVPAVLMVALLAHQRDAWGASFGLWLFGVSLLDLAPYVYDALHPQLVLLNGQTGEDGGHDWIFLLSSVGLLKDSHAVGRLFQWAGIGVMLAAVFWNARLLVLMRGRVLERG
jgi:hypothetical protein